MATELKRLNMKSSLASTNTLRYQWLCQHYIQLEDAQPENYHNFPLKFILYLRFHLHFFSWVFTIFENATVQFILSCVMLYYAHKWSYLLYYRKIDFLYVPYSCVDFPLQWHCEILNSVQNNTFTSIMEMKKTFVVLLTRLLLDYVAKLVSRSSRFFKDKKKRG